LQTVLFLLPGAQFRCIRVSIKFAVKIVELSGLLPVSSWWKECYGVISDVKSTVHSIIAQNFAGSNNGISFALLTLRITGPEKR